MLNLRTPTTPPYSEHEESPERNILHHHQSNKSTNTNVKNQHMLKIDRSASMNRECDIQELIALMKKALI